MLSGPRKQKFRKAFKGRIHGNAYTGVDFAFGAYGLRAMEPGRMSANQIEAVRKCVSRSVKRGGRFWSRLFPHVPVTAKPIEVRMGGGKGGIDKFIARVYPGSMLFELDGISEEMARVAFTLAASKLPFAVKFVRKEEGVYVKY